MGNIEGIFLHQKTISKKNMEYLGQLCAGEDEEVRRHAEAVREAATLRSYRRKRRGFLAHNHPDLFARLVELGYYLPWGEEEYDADASLQSGGVPWGDGEDGCMDDGACDTIPF